MPQVRFSLLYNLVWVFIIFVFFFFLFPSVQVFPSVSTDLVVWLKGESFTVDTLLGGDSISSTFTRGSMIIFRLAPQV